MRPRTTGLLALATLLVGLALILDQRDIPVSGTDTLLQVPPSAVTSIRIERPGESLLLRKEASIWKIVEPIDAFADTARVEVLLETLANPGELRPIELADENEAAFGLDPPVATLRLATIHQELASIRLGQKTPLGERAYLQRGDGSETLVASSDIPFAANRGFEDLRRRQVFTEALDPTEIQLRRTGLPEIVLRATEQDWQMLKPYSAKASTSSVKLWIRAVRGLEAKSFFDEPAAADLAAYGFAPAPLEIVWKSAGRTHRIWVGGPNLRAGDDEIWIRTDQFPTLYSVPRSEVAAIDLTPETIRDKSLIRLSPADIEKLTLSQRSEPDILLERRGDQWLANKARAETIRVESYLAMTLALAGAQTLSTAGGAEHFGLDQPDIVVTFSGNDGETLARFLIASFGEADVINREGSALVYTITSEQRRALEKSVADFR